MSEGVGRLVGDFFSYLVFLGSSYIIFSTNFYFKYVLIPFTLYAFLFTLSRRFSDGFSSATKLFYDKFPGVAPKTSEGVEDNS